jgi:hypothetical protein
MPAIALQRLSVRDWLNVHGTQQQQAYVSFVLRQQRAAARQRAAQADSGTVDATGAVPMDAEQLDYEDEYEGDHAPYDPFENKDEPEAADGEDDAPPEAYAEGAAADADAAPQAAARATAAFADIVELLGQLSEANKAIAAQALFTTRVSAAERQRINQQVQQLLSAQPSPEEASRQAAEEAQRAADLAELDQLQSQVKSLTDLHDAGGISKDTCDRAVEPLLNRIEELIMAIEGKSADAARAKARELVGRFSVVPPARPVVSARSPGLQGPAQSPAAANPGTNSSEAKPLVKPKDPPTFEGNFKTDMPVRQWLTQVADWMTLVMPYWCALPK